MSVSEFSTLQAKVTSPLAPSTPPSSPTISQPKIPSEAKKTAATTLATQTNQPAAPQTNPIKKEASDPEALKQAAQALSVNTSTGAELLNKLDTQLQSIPALKDDAPSFCQNAKILLNTCLTGTQEEKDGALSQMKNELAFLADEGVDQAILDSIAQKAQVFHDGKTSTEMTEKELVKMVQTVIENSEHAKLGKDFANLVQEQITGSRSAPSDKAKEAHMEGLAASLAILEEQYVSSSMLKTLEDVDTLRNEPPTNAITQALFAKVEGNEQRTAALTTLLGKFGNSESAINILHAMPEKNLFTLLDATHNLTTGDKKAHIEFADRLDDAFMSHLEMHDDLAKVKQESFAHLDIATQKQIESNHTKHMACSLVVDALPGKHPLKEKALTEITHGDILSLIQHNTQYKLPDIALCNTYFLLGEGAVDASGNAISAEGLAKDLPTEWLGTTLYKDLASRGVSSTKQLNEGMDILNGTIMSRSAKDAMVSLIASSRSDAKAQAAEANLRRLATYFLGIDSGASITTESLLAMCADLTLPQDTGIIGAYGVLTQKEGYTARVDETFAAMVEQQKPKKTKGETLGYSVLTMQRALVRDVKELSALDLSTLGASPEDVKDPAALKHFVENVWQDTNKNNWATAILLKSYLDEGGNDPRFTDKHPALKENEHIFQAPSPKDLESLKLFTDSGRKAMVAQLDKGRTASSSWLSEGSDDAGRLLKDLGRRYCGLSTGKAKGDAEVKVGDQSFIPSEAEPETLRKAMLALINGSSVTIDGEEHSYLCPVDCAHAAMLDKHQEGELRSINRIQHGQEKATGQVEDSTIAKQIRRDFAPLAGLADRKANATDSLLTEFMTAVNNNPNFASRVKPLALLDAQRQCGVAHVKNLFTPENEAKTQVALAQSLQTMGIGKKESELVAAGIISEYNKSSSMAKAINSMGERLLTAYALRSDAKRLAKAPDAVKSFVEIDRIEQNTLKVLEELPANSAFSIAHTASATASVGASVGAVSLSASVKVGEEDGVTLWHSGEGKGEKFGISISRGYVAGLQGSASAMEILSLDASVDADTQKGFVLEFDTKEDCAQFASRFLSNTAKREDIALASKVHIGESHSIAGSVSVGLGGEQEVGVCTVALGASASISGKVQYNKSVSGHKVTTTSTSTVTREASASASVSASVEQGNASVETSLEKTFFAYENTSTQTNTVITSQGSNALISAESIAAVSLQSANKEGLAQFCASHGVSSELALEIQNYLTENNLDGVTLEAHYTLNDHGRAAIGKESTDTIINNASNYTLTSMEIVSSEDGDSRGFDLGFLQNQTTTGRTTTKSFAIA